MVTRPQLSILVAAVLLAAPAGSTGAPVAQAHGLGGPLIQVPGGRVDPGREFEFWGADFAADALVDLSLATGGNVLPLGRVTAGADGHFTASILMPAAAVPGYSELRADDGRSGRATVWVQVGDVPGGIQQAGAAWLGDPSVIVLVVALAGGLLALGFLALRRGRRNEPQRAGAPVRGPLVKRRRRPGCRG